MKSVPVLLTILALLLAGCASNGADTEAAAAPAEGGARYIPDSGTFPVGAIPDATIRDVARNKDLEMSIDYPTRGGPYPVVIFSHGFGGSKNGYVGLAAHWVSNGYVVIRPTHADSGALRQALDEQKEENPNRTMRERLDAAETVWEKQGPADWENRVQDIRSIIDSLASLEERYPELRGRIDREKVSVGGHSYGAFTAMLIGGVRSSQVSRSLADDRVDAVVAMSPPGTSERLGLTRESFATLTRPALFLTGTEDKGLDESETAEWRREGFENSPAGDKYLAVIQGARHSTFTGRMLPPQEELRMPDTMNPYDPRRLDPAQRPRRSSSMGDPVRERNLFGIVKITSLAFTDAYLKNEAPAKDYLTTRLVKLGPEVKIK